MEFITNSNLPRYTPAYPHFKNLNQHTITVSGAFLCALNFQFKRLED